jgi:cytochrome c peroxidase
MTQGIRSHLVAYLKRHCPSLCLLVSFIFVCLLLLEGSISSSQSPRALPEPSAAASGEPITPLPLSVDLDPKRVALGQRLFNDVRLSRDNTKSCATCHPLEQGGMDGRRRATSANDSQPARNTPTIFNVGFNASFNWDGIADTLEAQAEIVVLSPRLMSATWPELLAKLRADADYVAGFKEAYAEGPTRANVLAALADFQRSLVTPNARFDRYLRGERHALTQSEQQGYTLFKSYGCVACHQGMNIGGNMYQKFGVFAETSGAEIPADLGRYVVTKALRDREVFRVPSLRNVAATGPYFHDGRAPTLEEAVTTMVRVQLGRTLSPDEIRLIVQFLHTLTGEYQGRPVGTPEKKRQ